MIFDGRPTHQLAPDDIHSLIENGVREDQFIDFKREPYRRNDHDKRELLKDVTAFANATGGYILIGVDENGEHRASELVGVDDAESVRRSMLDRCLTLIDPRLTELDIGVIAVDGHDIVVCRVPESPRKPHASVPDREHHSFWLRYQDGVKLMTIAEIREAIQGDAVQRELADLKREIVQRSEYQLVVDELARDVGEQDLTRLQTLDALSEHAERVFLREVGDRPYIRLTATPLLFAACDIRPHRDDLATLLSDPPRYRAHGWDIGTHGLGPSPRQTAGGLRIATTDSRHLRLYWNGHLEYWMPADEETISWGMEENLPPAERSFNPLAIIESTGSFIQLARQVWRTAEVSGNAEFRLAMHGVNGRRLPPYASNTYGRMFGIPAGLSDPAMGTFQDDDLRFGPFQEDVTNLPGTVAFRLISDVYYRLGYEREHVPYFDEEDRFMYDVEVDGPGQ